MGRKVNAPAEILQIMLSSVHPLALRFWLLYASACLLFLLIFGVILPAFRQAARHKAVKVNMHQIQLEIERFAVDSVDGSYPRHISEVLRGGYLTDFPLNPFSGKPMQCLPPGSEIPPGDFVYEPRWDSEDRRGAPSAYFLRASF